MPRPHHLLIWLIASLLGAVSSHAQPISPRATSVTDAIQSWLGPDAAGAKFVGVRDGVPTVVTLADLKADAIAPKETSTSISRPVWSEDGAEVLYSARGHAYVIGPNLERRRVLPNETHVYDPNFWTDPKTGQRHVVFADADIATSYEPEKPDFVTPGHTWRAPYPTGVPREHLFPFPCDSGLSRDGTRLGEAYGGALMIDLPNRKVRVLFRGQACNGTISPDDSYRLMHLMLPHDHFVVRNEYGRELWRIEKPNGSSEWQTPRWSNHPDWCMATAKMDGTFVPVLIDMVKRRSLPLPSLGGGWWAPKLWLPSGTEAPLEKAGPIDDLKLSAELVHYKQSLARAACYTPILNELGHHRTEEANLIIKTVMDAGWKTLESASERTPTDAYATYMELAATYAGNRVGEVAAENLEGGHLQRELDAWKTWEALKLLDHELTDLPGAKRSFTHARFANRNQATLVRMIPLARELRFKYPGTAAAERASDLSETLGLPETTSLPANRELAFEGTISRISTVPTPGEIAPYTAALTWIEYEIDKFLSQPIDGFRVMVVHWGMQNSETTEAARWQVGTKQRLRCDLFSAHPELATLTRAQDGFEDVTLQEFYALSITNLNVVHSRPAAGEFAWRKGQKLDGEYTGKGRVHPETGLLEVEQGSVVAPGGPALSRDCKAANRVQCDIVLHPARDKQGGCMLALMDENGRTNLAIHQEEGQVVLQLRTSELSSTDAPTRIPLLHLNGTERNHIHVRYESGKLTVSHNKEEEYTWDGLKGDLSTWTESYLVLGNDLPHAANWDGRIEEVRLRSGEK